METGGHTIPGPAPLRFVRGVLAEHMATHGIPGAAAVVVREGKITDTVCLGTTDRESGTPVTADAAVPLGPASKTLAAVGVLRLVAEGVIGLDDLVARHVGATGATALAGNPMTVGQLISQRPGSGVAHVRRSRPWSAARAGLMPSHAPGWSLDLARIAELVTSVSGEPFEVFMAKHVFGVLDMWSGAFSHLRLVSTDVGPGRRHRPGAGAANRLLVASAECTPLEFARFLGGLAGDGTAPGGSLLPADLLARMTRPSAPLPSSGLGVWLDRGRSETIAHVGGNAGGTAGAYAPGTGAAVALVFRPDRNFNHAFPGPSRLAGEILDGILHGPSPLIPPSPSPAPTFPQAS